jgi:hypothetical protein
VSTPLSSHCVEHRFNYRASNLIEAARTPVRDEPGSSNTSEFRPKGGKGERRRVEMADYVPETEIGWLRSCRHHIPRAALDRRPICRRSCAIRRPCEEILVKFLVLVGRLHYRPTRNIAQSVRGADLKFRTASGLLPAIPNCHFARAIDQKQRGGLQPDLAGVLHRVQWWSFIDWVPLQLCALRFQFRIRHLQSPAFFAFRFLVQQTATGQAQS